MPRFKANRRVIFQSSWKYKPALPVSPVAETGLKVGRFPAEDAGINTGALAVGGVNRKKQRIEKVDRGTTEVRVAILDIPAKIHTALHIVFAAVQRERIRVGVNALVKDFREFRYMPQSRGWNHLRRICGTPGKAASVVETDPVYPARNSFSRVGLKVWM